jgi:hypothetical protein
VLWDIHRGEIQLLVCTHLGKQCQMNVYRLFADAKRRQDCSGFCYGRVLLHAIRVVLRPRHSNRNSIVIQTTHADYHEHTNSWWLEAANRAMDGCKNESTRRNPKTTTASHVSGTYGSGPEIGLPQGG